MDWAQILVILLSVFLAIFLLLGIILTVMLIRLTHQIKSVTNSAERTVKSIESAVRGFNKVASPLIIGKMIAKWFKKHKEKQED
jgi:uncharacterized protein YoxC